MDYICDDADPVSALG